MKINALITQTKDLFFEKIYLKRELNNYYRTLGGHIFFQSLSSAVRFDLFSLIETIPGMTTEEISKKLQIDFQPCRILLLGLTASGMLKKKKARYYNSRVASLFLTNGKPYDMRNIVLWQHFINYNALFYFHESIQTNKNIGLKVFEGHEPTLYQRLHRAPELHSVFQKAMQEISAQANQELIENIDLRDRKTIVDVGGGNGSNLVKLVSKFTHLRGIVFDYPAACQIADENFKQKDLSSQLKTATGNCFSDPFPKSIDGILFCHFFTIWSPEENKKLIQKSFDSLPENGKLFVFNMVQDDSEDGPLTAAMASPYFLTLATGKGMLYTAKEYRQWMTEAGFKKVDVLRLPRNHVVITAVK